LPADDCWTLLADAHHGVLATVHPDRGVDAVPVVFAVVDGELAVPVDLVKAKDTTRLQRVRNLERDPRCTLLVDSYDDDWSQLWWVRVHATAVVRPPTEVELDALAARYPQYREPGTVVDASVLSPTTSTGWPA
jgi:PPOX class probable F420-dependent enzyme